MSAASNSSMVAFSNDPLGNTSESMSQRYRATRWGLLSIVVSVGAEVDPQVGAEGG